MRCLTLLNPGKNSRGLLQDISMGIEELGHVVHTLDLSALWGFVSDPKVEDEGRSITGQLFQDYVEQNRIDCSIGMWCNGIMSLPLKKASDGRLVSWHDILGIPHLQYWWDAPHWFSGKAAHELFGTGLFSGPYIANYINNRHTGAEMANILGFGNVIASPNAVNTKRFFPDTAVQREYDLLFISGGGDPKPSEVMLEELEAAEPDMQRIRDDEASKAQKRIGRFCSQQSKDIQNSLQQLLAKMLEQRLKQRHQSALQQLQAVVKTNKELAVAAQWLMKRPSLYVQATDLIRRIERWERPFMVAYLSRHFNCLRLGEQDYSSWGIRGDSLSFVPYDQQASYYARAEFALNVMRWQDDCSLNSKIFEITACRCGCLQSYRSGVDELFELDEEILVFNEPAEAREILQQTLDSPTRCEQIREAGYQRTLKDHTWATRFESIMETLAGLGTRCTKKDLEEAQV